MIKVVGFDCFGTLLDMSGIPRGQIKAYVEHVKRETFEPYKFPDQWFDLRAFSDVKAAMWAIRNQLDVDTWAFSNGSVELLANDLYHSGVPSMRFFDCIKERCYKPNPEAYRRFPIVAGVKPHECLIVTANPTFGDVEGAAAAGMQSLVIRQGKSPHTVWGVVDYLSHERQKG